MKVKKKVMAVLITSCHLCYNATLSLAVFCYLLFLKRRYLVYKLKLYSLNFTSKKLI